jgi:hypothetical protein
MIDRRQFSAGLASSLLVLRAQGMLKPRAGKRSAFRAGQEFRLESQLGNVFFAWPRTLLSFPVESSGPFDSQHLRLLCVETGKAVLFQQAQPRTSGASPELLFLSDLPANAVRTYRLVRASEVAAPSSTPLAITREPGSITINLGPMQVRIPASQAVTGEAPGPILQVARGGAWKGQSTLHLDGTSITSILTEEIESGPLRSTHRITYTAGNGAIYIATIQCIAGMDFVRLYENMEALPADARGQFDLAWTGCTFDFRQSSNHPYNFPKKPLASYAAYPWERIAPSYMDTQFGVAPGIDANGKLPFALRTYEPMYDVAAACFANFWGDASQDAAAIFIDRMEEWEDHQYALWRASSRIEVNFVDRSPSLHFVWQLARGTRSTCVSFYDHARDIEVMQGLARAFTHPDPMSGSTGFFPSSHALELQNWHGTLDLNKVKDWQLFYPSTEPLPKPLFTETSFKNAAEYYAFVSRSPFLTELAVSGVRQSDGFGPVSARQILDRWVPGYQVFQQQLTAAQRQQLQAILLLLAYVLAGEDVMPLERMLGGHPNFLSDVKSTPPGMSFLFPAHPAADVWGDEWEAYLRMNTRYHTRPPVKAWDARGGRWTENLGTYVWAFLRPALRAAFLLKQRDGYERFCTPQVIELGDWLVNALSAPFAGESPETMKLIASHPLQYWGVVSPQDGPRRVHPPVGAHSERRKPPRKMWYMGTCLRNYSPLTAEYLMWASRPTDQDMEMPLTQPDPYAAMFAGPDNHGTNPHLVTSKFTGFGIMLRAAVDTPRELSIHLLQIDDGPNYRWGTAAEGSCGGLYFFADGKGFSYNGFEDAGDRIDQDTDYTTNFGVWKDGAYRAIGQNVLSRPLYDLSFAQFAEIVPREGKEAYSWPEYVSRSVLLAGDDYFLIHDKVFNPEIHHRFSWFVRKGDEFPHLTPLTRSRSRESFTTVETEATTGRWLEGAGDSLVVVTHKEGIRAEHSDFGASVTTASSTDLLFASSSPISVEEDGHAFSGTSGILRVCRDHFELALFHGTHIAGGGLSITTADTDLGISASIPNSGGAIAGYFFAPSSSEVEIGVSTPAERLVLYIDGERTESTGTAGRITARLPGGRHRWELTEGLPVPLAPSVLKTELLSGGAVVHASPVAAATSYIFELSSDEARTWQSAGTAVGPSLKLSGLANGTKYHVRVTARNAEHSSVPGPEYPLYVTAHPPSPPDGLFVELTPGAAILTWGEVLGATEYRLYRREKRDAHFRCAYLGAARTWKDTDTSITPPDASPDQPRSQASARAVFEYYVTAVSHNGESVPSRTANTDPASWRNWNPTGREPFRRVLEQRTLGAGPNDGGGRYYPQ